MRSLQIIALCLMPTLACSDPDPGATSATAATSSGSTSAGSSSSGPTTGTTPTTGTATTGTATGTSSGSDSATGQTSGTTTTSTSTSTGADTSTGTATTSTGADTSSGTSGSSGETGVMVACDGAGTSNLEGVCIVFPPQKDSFTLAEAKAGVEFKYEVVVAADVPDVTSESINTCDQPGPGGLFVSEQIEGNGQSYCLCDQGKCPNPMEPKFVLAAGNYPDSLPWDGVNWSGPSDFNNPKGPPFPPGMYTVKIRTIGQHEGQPYEVTGELPITLTP